MIEVNDIGAIVSSQSDSTEDLLGNDDIRPGGGGGILESTRSGVRSFRVGTKGKMSVIRNPV